MRKRPVYLFVFVIVSTICIGIWARWVITAIKIQQRNGLGLVWIRLILATGAKMLVGHAYQLCAFCPCDAVLTYQTTPTAMFKRTLLNSAKHENDYH